MAENKSNLWNPQEGKLYDLDIEKKYYEKSSY